MTATLAAWSVRRYGSPDQLVPVSRPIPAPGPGEALIRIRASAVSRADGMMRAGTPRFARLFLGLRRPRHDLVGTCLSGEVVATGPDVTRFAVGDEVFGEAGLTFGANASHICLRETGVLMPKPASLSHEEAAVMCDGPLTSLNFLREVADLRAGEGF
ncbi:alcohol dehydrogenase catalytic domain-containing protein [Rhizorhabdus sp.]|uniref:alcohol dehydrogenase catalytic domain-containing protein n=1 Tax=Rhizorhabdus sp. TaxID=1968843 RepID=UPI0019B84FFC|nr:alcohol dehydrogenase catalytic domain-containing protein [Rhizorhabdus sp.]MBD3763035.1 alcohol dehydrogenase catalytic domain-containing protein [Rhizorhabdus sp.]MBD3788401.1 alcohol dehydrogenase catalytic domain-containing protein [Sphingomonadales bacterium]